MVVRTREQAQERGKNYNNYETLMKKRRIYTDNSKVGIHDYYKSKSDINEAHAATMVMTNGVFLRYAAGVTYTSSRKYVV